MSFGSSLGIFSPGSPPAQEPLERGLDWLREAGFTLRLGRTAAPATGLHAGSVEERVQDLYQLLEDRSVGAILCTRGGSGTLGLLPLVDFGRFARAGVTLVGMSDVTALHLALFRHTGVVGLSAPMVVQLSTKLPAYTRGRWLSLLRGQATPGPVPVPKDVVLRASRRGGAREVEGRLFPCNLSLLTRLLGTPHLPPLDGAILVLEDIHETPQSLDRMASALQLSDVGRHLSGVVLAQFTECEARSPEVSPEEGIACLRAWALSLNVPVLEGFPYGHEALATPLPFGTRARLRIDPPGLDLLEVPQPLSRVNRSADS